MANGNVSAWTIGWGVFIGIILVVIVIFLISLLLGLIFGPIVSAQGQNLFSKAMEYLPSFDGRSAHFRAEGAYGGEGGPYAEGGAYGRMGREWQ